MGWNVLDCKSRSPIHQCVRGDNRSSIYLVLIFPPEELSSPLTVPIAVVIASGLPAEIVRVGVVKYPEPAELPVAADVGHGSTLETSPVTTPTVIKVFEPPKPVPVNLAL